jgi:hypothetical protein
VSTRAAGTKTPVSGFEALNPLFAEAARMKRLIIHGDPDIRKGAIIEHDGQEMVCFAVARQGDYHGPDRVQLWCTIGTEDERETFERRDFIPMHMEVEFIDVADVEVIEAKGDLAI